MPAIYPVNSCRKSCPWMQKSCQTQPKSCRTRMEVVPDSPEVVHKDVRSGDQQSRKSQKTHESVTTSPQFQDFCWPRLASLLVQVEDFQEAEC